MQVKAISYPYRVRTNPYQAAPGTHRAVPSVPRPYHPKHALSSQLSTLVRLVRLVRILMDLH